MTESTVDPGIAAAIEGLNQLNEWVQAHPELPGNLSGIGTWVIYGHLTDLAPSEVVRIICDGAPIGTIEKSVNTIGDDDLVFIRRHFGGGAKASYHTPRDEVCTRRVVGIETVEVPDPDAPKVTVEREIVEWDCAPILAAS